MAIIAFATGAISRRAGGRLKSLLDALPICLYGARGPHAAPGLHVGQRWSRGSLHISLPTCVQSGSIWYVHNLPTILFLTENTRSNTDMIPMIRSKDTSDGSFSIPSILLACVSTPLLSCQSAGARGAPLRMQMW